MKFRRQKLGSPSRSFNMFFLLLLVCAGGAGYFLFFERKAPTIDLQNVPENLAKQDEFTIDIADAGSGLRKVEILATQGDVSKVLYTSEHPRKGYYGLVGPAGESAAVKFDAKSLGFKDGTVKITVTASDFSLNGLFSGNSTTAAKESQLDSQPPVLQLIHSEQYISPGGTGIAIYRNNDEQSESGVYINGNFNKGYPVGDGRKDTYIAYFSLPYDTEKVEESRLYAADVAGNIASVPFTMNFKMVKFKEDRINVGDGFLNSKIPEFEQYYPEILDGSSVEKYLIANNHIRQNNNSRIKELSRNSSSERYWKGRFLRMAGSSHAGFADHRTYYYEGKVIDNQVHLGMDIASTQHANIKAANSGKVIFADYLGIYGNMVMIDHGQGVSSLYSHLSQINVSVGDMVASDDIIGLSGISGMAGGDHLHFSMIINGVFATPKEWWDPHWISVTIDEPLAASKF